MGFCILQFSLYAIHAFQRKVANCGQHAKHISIQQLRICKSLKIVSRVRQWLQEISFNLIFNLRTFHQIIFWP